MHPRVFIRWLLLCLVVFVSSPQVITGVVGCPGLTVASKPLPRSFFAAQFSVGPLGSDASASWLFVPSHHLQQPSGAFLVCLLFVRPVVQVTLLVVLAAVGSTKRLIFTAQLIFSIKPSWLRWP